MKNRLKQSIVMMSAALLLTQPVTAVVQAAGSTAKTANTTAKTATVQPAAQNAAPSSAGAFSVDAKAAILMDAATGQVLFQQNADEPLPPASMTKMMTEYLILDNIKNGKLKWDDTVTISDYSAFLTKGGDNSGIAKAAGDQYSVKDLFYAIAIYSDNGAAVSLAKAISGSEENFVKTMNDTAQKFGLSSGAHFIDTTGLDRSDLGQYAPSSIPGETTFTAHDSALIAYHLINDHPEMLDYAKIPAKKFRPTDANPMINWDWMLEGNANNVNFRKYVYPGLDGLKTGHTDKAGYCFTGTAVRNGMRLISVVMDATTREASFDETKKMLDYGFNSFEMKKLVASGTTIDSLPSVSVKKGVQLSVPLVTGTDVTMLVPKGMKDDQVTKTAVAVDENSRIAPIKKGDKLGTLKVTYNGIERSVDLVATEDVKKASWIRLLFRGIGNFFKDLFKKVV